MRSGVPARAFPPRRRPPSRGGFLQAISGSPMSVSSGRSSHILAVAVLYDLWTQSRHDQVVLGERSPGELQVLGGPMEPPGDVSVALQLEHPVPPRNATHPGGVDVADRPERNVTDDLGRLPDALHVQVYRDSGRGVVSPHEREPLVTHDCGGLEV